MMIAQITDMHIRPRGKIAYGRVDTNAMLEAAVATLEGLPRKPDLVIASGDLTDCGLAEEYEVLRDILDAALHAGLPRARQPRPPRRAFRRVRPGRLLEERRRLPALHDRRPRDAADRARHRGAGAGPWRDVRPTARLARGPAGGAARPADAGLHAPSAIQHRARRHGPHQLPQRPGDVGRAAPRRQYRARGLRPPSPAHHRALGRHGRLGGAQHRPPGDARPGPAQQHDLRDGAARLPTASLVEARRGW